MKEGYKKTELGWIPEEWNIKQLDKIAYLIDGDRSSKYPSQNDIVDEGVLFLSTSNIKNNKLVFNECRYITHEKFKSLSKGKLEDNDLLITLRGSIGNVAKFKVSGKYNTGFINAQMLIIRIKDVGIDVNYLWGYLISEKCQNLISIVSSGSAQPQLTKKDLSMLKIIIPTLKEQQKIADILEAVDAQIDDTHKLIGRTKELKKGLMQRLLTKGIGHREFKKSEVGEIPVEWEVESLGNLFKLSSGEGLSQKDIIDGPYPVYGGNGINGYHNKFLFEDSKVIIGRVGAKCGCIHKSSENSWITDNALYISNKQRDFNDDYMAYLLEFLDLNRLANKNAQPVISGQKIYAVLIGLPNIEEQKKIVVIISSVDAQIEEYENKKTKLEELKKGLMQKLLTGKIRVMKS